MANKLKTARKQNFFTQKQASEFLGISLRSYKSYENEANKQNNYKYKYFVEELEKKVKLDEDHGVLKLAQIEWIVNDVFKNYDIDYCYLYGSYANETAQQNSDVNLLMSSNINDETHQEVIKKLKEMLHKKIDLKIINKSSTNNELLYEALKNGIKIYKKSNETNEEEL